ncbi:peptidylprolyl isomerase [Mucilaginibacter sp. L3T2-6]|uniref:peptidylprolyl isomerase n=1 Tax=Mucilaginibacter sp. L3T2-6 TaxID=3062491 RepID=UPI0026750197|nr:peptidylprolyl isomerase [Mucilaginibacter sp. L3T2-6]MDO3642803.1 peptidylprolyl isomerase [Mucilaginibacter sp. L3T2-6]MDV6215452.1 peptidylprolyl isomerase [Mucilaginibacter sp. L3T2-6]
MKKIFLVCLSIAISYTAFAQAPIQCVIKTTLGNIGIELYPAKAPGTVANFMQYVDKKLYDGSSFFRVCTPANEANRKVKIQVIQGGNVPDKQTLDSIKIETTKQTGLRHKNGTLSMARSGPNSATSEFFICINDQPALDYGGARNPDGQGFAAFGKVTNGMDIVRKIQSQKDTSQYLVNPVKIYSISRVE